MASIFTPDQAQAMSLLGAGFMQGNPGQGFAQASGLLGSAPDRELRRKLIEAQYQETLAQADERTQKVHQAQAAQAEAARLQGILPSLYRQPGMVGGAPQPQMEGGVPMFSRPMGAGPMQSTPGGFDVQRAIQERMPPEMIKQYAGLDDIGKPKVARTIEIMRNGRPTTIQVDERGQEVGAGYEQWKAPVMQNLGGRTAAIDPVSLAERGSFAQSQSPDSLASNAIAIRGQNMTDARSREANSNGRVPAGYRASADGQGLEFIPGGPADPNAAKKAAPTEFQGKSAAYGARAQEADKTITALDGKYSPAGVNTKTALDNVPVLGGVLGGAANMAMSDNGQRAEQAQRDFVNAVLRQESGAAISAGEFDNAKKQYFPQPGDSEAVKAQKLRNRQIAIQGFRENSRPGAVDAVAAAGAPKADFRYVNGKLVKVN